MLFRSPDLNLDDLLVHYPNKANRLEHAIRNIIGFDAEKVGGYFTRFVQKYPQLNAHQMRFLELLKKHIAQYGSVTLEKLYETPFTNIHSEGLDGVFPEPDQADDLVQLIQRFEE